MSKPYDIEDAFAAIEEELIESMVRNMKRHRAEEDDEGIQWEMWQAMQLESLERYKKANKERFSSQFSNINERIDELIREANKAGYMEQEVEILEAIKKGFKGFKRPPNTMQAEFFKLNERKLEALIKATTDDMQKAETAILRMANDQYRKTIFNAQVYANSGAGTYEKAVDMATKDMLSSGLNCVEYANGARHTLKDYADMAVRTASKRAYLQGEGTKRQEWGISTVIMNKRGNPCPKCLPFCGKVLIDDVWSGGSKKDGNYPLMSYAISQGLYHPRCKDSHTTYFPGISSADDTWTKKELEDIGLNSKEEAKQQYAHRQAEKFGRLEKYSLDEENQEFYGHKANMWKRVYFKTGGMNSREYVEYKRPLANFKALSPEQVVNVLRKESEEWINMLSEKEKIAIRKYTFNSGDARPNRFFERLNAMLRGEIPEESKLKKYADIISNALKKSALSKDVICYRSLDVNPIGDKEAGSVIRLKQFISTSVIESRAFNNEVKMIIYVKKGSTAAYIESLSKYPSQRELLLDKDCMYRVISNKGNIVELEVI